MTDLESITKSEAESRFTLQYSFHFLGGITSSFISGVSFTYYVMGEDHSALALGASVLSSIASMLLYSRANHLQRTYLNDPYSYAILHYQRRIEGYPHEQATVEPGTSTIPPMADPNVVPLFKKLS